MNDLTPNGGTAPAVPSVFGDFETFRQSMEMATALAKSKLVPEAFQNSPESCLIAIDLSRRLNVSPFALIPQLYVIDSKPAFSTQFLITLVNRSGRFERLDWETGTDGETSVHFFSRWNDRTKQVETVEETVPNLWAVAVLVEKKTGKKFRSPRVDVAFAEKNGWTTKKGSKWRTMPELMVAYRSASILIKRTCPELTLGIDVAEDVADAFAPEAPAELPREVVVESRSEPGDSTGADLVEIFLRKIEKAPDAETLETLGAEISRSGFSPEERAVLAEAYRNRRESLKLKVRKESGVSPSELVTLIRQASTFETLDDLRTGILTERKKGTLDAETANAYLEKIADRRAELEGIQAKNAESFAADLQNAKTREDVKQILTDAEAFVSRGILSAEKLVEIQHAADELVEEKKL